MELFFQFEEEAIARADSFRARGLEVQITEYVGGHCLSISGPAELVAGISREVVEEWRSQEPRVLQGPVRWFSNEKGYGRITGDDGYVYFVHFSVLEMEGYKSLQEGQRVEFTRGEAMADHGRAGAMNVRVID
jgi:CspA family cold shock protein